ncbi:MAG: hypothetical protein JNN02_08845 [Tabrizicola sp.]|nr:hypothetical protein [Tabrizicola sp.]
MNEVVGVLKNTGLFTIVGGPIFLYYCLAKLRGKISLNWYYFVPFAQAYILTGTYFALFGPQVSTTPRQTILYLVLGSHILTTALCIIIYYKAGYERPRRMFPFDLKRGTLAILGVYPFWMLFGLILFLVANMQDRCDGARCDGVLLLNGNYGFTGTLLFSAFCMGIAVIWLNFLCYIYLPYISPQKEAGNE